MEADPVAALSRRRDPEPVASAARVTEAELDVAADALHLARYGEVIRREYPAFLHGEGSDMQDNCYQEANAIRAAIRGTEAGLHEGDTMVEGGRVFRLTWVIDRDATARLASADSEPS